MTRDDQSVGREVKAAVSFMMSRVSQKNTHGGLGRKFVAGCSRQVGVAFATEDAKMIIGGRSPKKGMVRGGGSNRLGGQNVDEVGGCLQGFDPEGGWKGCLKQKAANNIVDGTDDALSLTVLGRGVGA